MTRRWLLGAVLGAPMLVATGLGCTAPSTTPTAVGPTQSERGGAETNDWLLTAEAESRAHLSDQCYYAAPLNTIEPGSKLFRECSERANAAVTAEWKRIADAALAECSAAADDGGCCFERYVPGREYESRLAECNATCAANRHEHGSRPRSRGACSSRAVGAHEPTDSRFLTPAVDQVVGHCESGEVGSQACLQLPSYGERRLCVVNCKVHERWWHGSRDFQAAVQRCVAANGESNSTCTLDDDSIGAGFTRGNCAKACKAVLQERRTPHPTKP